MPTSIGDVIRLDVDVDVPAGAVPAGDPGATTAPGVTRPPPLPVDPPGGAAPGTAPGGCAPVGPCGAESPLPVRAPDCDWSVDVCTVVPQPATARAPATTSTAAARARSDITVTRPTLGTSQRLGDVPPDESAAPHWSSATKSPLERAQLGGSRRTQRALTCAWRRL